MGTQKYCLIETVLFEHPKHMLKVIGKKIFTTLRSKIFVYLNLCDDLLNDPSSAVVDLLWTSCSAALSD